MGLKSGRLSSGVQKPLELLMCMRVHVNLFSRVTLGLWTFQGNVNWPHMSSQSSLRRRLSFKKAPTICTLKGLGFIYEHV